MPILTEAALRVDLAAQAANRYPAIPFEVPAGTGSFEVFLEGADGVDGLVIDLGCEAPGWWCGWSGGARRHFVVGRDDATPGYLQTHGVPQRPDDLRQHRLITNSAVAFLNHWPFLIDGEPQVRVADGHWRSGSTAITARMALQGLGIARLATVVAEPLVRQGLLAPVLAPFVDLQPSPIHAITLTRRHRLPKIQACIDHWAQWFSPQESRA